jgi:hypothetical protein
MILAKASAVLKWKGVCSFFKVDDNSKEHCMLLYRRWTAFPYLIKLRLRENESLIPSHVLSLW